MSGAEQVGGWRGEDCPPSDTGGGAERGGGGGPTLQDLSRHLQESARNGVVINGIILWIDIQMNETAEEIWKNIALQRFTDEELREAKRNLWMAAGSNLAPPQNRQGSNSNKNDCEKSMLQY